MGVEQTPPQTHRARRNQTPSAEYRLPSRETDGYDAYRMANRVEVGKIAFELEASGGRIGEVPLQCCHVRAGNSVSRFVGPPVDPNFDRSDAVGVERPAGDMQTRVDDRFASGRIDRSGRREWRGGI